MPGYEHVVLFSLVGGVFSLAGGLLLLSSKRLASGLAKIATPFAAGTLLAAVFFDLLPEALHAASADVLIWTLVGMVGFFLLEYFFHWFHHHHEHHQESSPAALIIIGDILHNLLDGLAIGAAFLIDIPTGIVTAFAVAAHEIPQEIGDFGLLLKFGYEKKRVIVINVASALASTVGALAVFSFGSTHQIPTGKVLALTAGMFIYVAASDLIPTIHLEAKRKLSYLPALLFLAGIMTIGLTTSVAHRYIGSDDNHQESELHENSEHDFGNH